MDQTLNLKKTSQQMHCGMLPPNPNVTSVCRTTRIIVLLHFIDGKLSSRPLTHWLFHQFFFFSVFIFYLFIQVIWRILSLSTTARDTTTSWKCRPRTADIACPTKFSLTFLLRNNVKSAGKVSRVYLVWIRGPNSQKLRVNLGITFCSEFEIKTR